MVTGDTVDRYFREYGGPFERVDDMTWRSTFHGDAERVGQPSRRHFSFRVRLHGAWIGFLISPYLVPAKEASVGALHERLLFLNHQMNMAKFALDETGQVALTVELPTENLDYSEFRDAIDALCYHADDLFEELSRLARR
jgi:hypothetical protein